MSRLRKYIAIALAAWATTLPACGSMGGGMRSLLHLPCEYQVGLAQELAAAA